MNVNGETMAIHSSFLKVFRIIPCLTLGFLAACNQNTDGGTHSTPVGKDPSLAQVTERAPAVSEQISCYYMPFFRKIESLGGSDKDAVFHLIENHDIDSQGSCETCHKSPVLNNIHLLKNSNNKKR